MRRDPLLPRQTQRLVMQAARDVAPSPAEFRDIDAPEGGWPSGDDFQVNLVYSKKQSDRIYAQSVMFDIEEEKDWLVCF